MVTSNIQPSQLEAIKNKLKIFAVLLQGRVNASSEYAKKIERETPTNKERYYHDGKSDEGMGILLTFEDVFFDELQQ